MTPLPIDEVAAQFGMSRRSLYRLIGQLKVTKYRMPGKGKATYVDPDEVRRKWKPQRVEPKPVESRRPSVLAAASAPSRARTDDGRPVLVAAIIPHPDGRPEVLMTGRRFGDQPILSWPGGHVREGEDPAAAVLREIGEELEVTGASVAGLLTEVDTHLDVSQFWGHRFRHGYRSYHYEVDVASPEVRLIDHEELSGVEWVSIDQVAEAVAPLPEELAAIAVRCARQAVAEHVRPAAEQ